VHAFSRIYHESILSTDSKKRKFMSHVVTITCEIRDNIALELACSRIGAALPQMRSTRLFGVEATGYCVQLLGWRYPIVCNVQSGQLQYDNFKGRWGDEEQLHQLLQAYAAEKVKLEARRQGQTITETTLPDGSLKLTIQLGGAA
jgi:hypothetical protein